MLYWSADTLFWQVSVDYNMNIQYQNVRCKPWLHASVDLLAWVWPPCSSPLASGNLIWWIIILTSLTPVNCAYKDMNDHRSYVHNYDDSNIWSFIYSIELRMPVSCLTNCDDHWCLCVFLLSSALRSFICPLELRMPFKCCFQLYHWSLFWHKNNSLQQFFFINSKDNL